MAGIEINGKTYELPELASFDMDEAQILFDYSGTVLEDFAPALPTATDEEKAEHVAGQLAKVANPAFKKALVHVAYRRANPGVPDDEIRAAVGTANILAVTEALLADDGGDAGPPELSGPTSPSEIGTPTETSSSGNSSPTTSDARDDRQPSIGTGESGTSSPPLARVV